MTATIAGRSRSPKAFNRGRLPASVDAFLTGWRLLLAVAAVYLAYALFVTWPLATNLSGQLSAPSLLEDAAGTASYFADLTSHHLSPFAPGHIALLNAPQGLPVTWALNLAQAPSYLLTWVLVLVLGPVAGSNVFMLLGFVLSGETMFAVVRRLFGSRIVALFAGFAFAFYPFAVAASSEHYAFVHGWPLLLAVWRLIEMIHLPNRRNAVLAGVASAFAMWWNPYFELLGGFAFATCLAVCLGVGMARRTPHQALRASGTALLPVAVLGLFFAALLKLGGGLSGAGSPARPMGQVFAFAAHLREYLLPGPYNLLFGHLTGPYLIAHLGVGDTWDTALYPGYVVVLLAMIGFILAVRALRAQSAALADLRVVAVITSGALAAVAFVSSGPPTISLGGFHVWLPSGVLFLITPTWQTFARFVILLELALIIMMAAALVRFRRSARAPQLWLAFAIIGLLLVVDLWNRQPVRTVSTTPPVAYAWLRAHPGGTVVDYPVFPGDAAQSARGYFWAAYDRHPLLEGSVALSSTESMKLDLANLADPQTAGKLAAYRVRYIVVNAGTPGGSTSRLIAAGYKPIVVSARGSASLWRVTSPPAATSVDFFSGFDWLSGFPTYDRRLMQTTGVLAVHARDCQACRGTVHFSVASVGRALTLTVRDQRTGGALARVGVPNTGFVQAHVRDVRLVGGNARLELRMSPTDRSVVILTRSATLTLQHR